VLSAAIYRHGECHQDTITVGFSSWGFASHLHPIPRVRRLLYFVEDNESLPPSSAMKNDE